MGMVHTSKYAEAIKKEKQLLAVIIRILRLCDIVITKFYNYTMKSKTFKMNSIAHHNVWPAVSSLCVSGMR